MVKSGQLHSPTGQVRHGQQLQHRTMLLPLLRPSSAGEWRSHRNPGLSPWAPSITHCCVNCQRVFRKINQQFGIVAGSCAYLKDGQDCRLIKAVTGQPDERVSVWGCQQRLQSAFQPSVPSPCALDQVMVSSSISSVINCSLFTLPFVFQLLGDQSVCM